MPKSDDLTTFIATHATPYDPATDTYRRPPFAAPVKAGKNTPIYNAHSYHTKVPPQGIVPYILHYTDPDDLILDPFCGSGMTGVAALMCAHPPAEALHLVPGAQPGPRHAVLNDLSPAATHIAYNYCTPVDVDALKREFERIQAAVKDEFDWLYGTTCDRCGGPATIQYTIWSDVFECARCGEELVLWDLAVDRKSGKVRKNFACPSCRATWRKLQLARIHSAPVLTVYECQDCQPRRDEHPTTEDEKKHLAELESRPIPYWYPNEEIDPGREMMRHGLLKRGLTRTIHFYTTRNLWAFARLWHESEQAKPQLRSHLRFVLTAILHRATLLNRLRPSRAGDPLSGTLYVGAFIREDNVGQLFERKFQKTIKALSGLSYISAVAIHSASATNLQSISDDSVDYVFTDPPFGQNIFYTDCSILWESWLQLYTDEEQEIVCNERRQNGPFKTITDYGRLMTESFQEMYRVLKPGRWASVVFHNSDDRIWQAILDAAEAAGFELVEINSFDKQQLSFKGVRGAKGLERVTNKDIVLNLHKPCPGEVAAPNGRAYADQQEVRIVEGIAAFLETNPPPEERTLQGLWNHALARMLRDGSVTFSMAQVETLLPHYFKQVEGRWYLRGEQVIEGGLGLIVSDEPSAIAWLTRVLENEPQTTGDLIPKWQMTTLDAQIAKPLDQILEENFWPDEHTGRWRLPTPEERHKMSAREEVAAQAHLRVIRRYLEGRLDRRSSDLELCAWIRYCYGREFYAEAVALFPHVDETRVDADEIRQVSKIVEVCRLKVETQ